MTLAPRVILVTATAIVPERELLKRLGDAAALGPDRCARLAVQLRDPELSSRALLSFGRRLREATRAMSAKLIVNDRLDLARDLDADGVHLGSRSVGIADARAFLGASAWVSIACHSVADVTRAAEMGANAVLLSPIFASPGKGLPLGLAAIAAARAAIGGSLGLVALGGVDEETAALCVEAGASGVAVVRADLGSTLGHLLAG